MALLTILGYASFEWPGIPWIDPHYDWICGAICAVCLWLLHRDKHDKTRRSVLFMGFLVLFCMSTYLECSLHLWVTGLEKCEPLPLDSIYPFVALMLNLVQLYLILEVTPRGEMVLNDIRRRFHNGWHFSRN